MVPCAAAAGQSWRGCMDSLGYHSDVPWLDPSMVLDHRSCAFQITPQRWRRLSTFNHLLPVTAGVGNALTGWCGTVIIMDAELEATVIAHSPTRQPSQHPRNRRQHMQMQNLLKINQQQNATRNLQSLQRVIRDD